MPANDPAAYQNMSTEELISSLEGEMANLDQSIADAGFTDPAMEGGEALEAEAGAEEALADAEGAGAPADAETALGNVMMSGVTDPGQMLDALRSVGFDLVRTGPAPVEEDQPPGPLEGEGEEAMPEEEEEIPFRDARRKAAEKAVGA